MEIRCHINQYLDAAYYSHSDDTMFVFFNRVRWLGWQILTTSTFQVGDIFVRSEKRGSRGIYTRWGLRTAHRLGKLQCGTNVHHHHLILHLPT